MDRVVGLPVYPKKPATPTKEKGDNDVPDVRGVQQSGRKSTGK